MENGKVWNLSDTRTWLYIVDDVLSKCRGIGNYLDDPICRRIAETMKEEWSKKIRV